MDKQDMIKYAAIALAAYLLYKWVTSQAQDAAVAEPAANKQLPGGTTAPPPVISKPSDADLHAAALDINSAGKAGNYQLSGYTWNWYRMMAAQSAGWSPEDVAAKTQVDVVPNMQTLMTAAQYHEALKAKGLSGGLGYSQSWGGGATVYRA